MTDPTNPTNPILSLVLDKILGPLSGYKTYLAAAGLLGLSLYDASTGQYEGAVQQFMAALAAVGIRHAVAKSA